MRHRVDENIPFYILSKQKTQGISSLRFYVDIFQEILTEVCLQAFGPGSMA